MIGKEIGSFKIVEEIGEGGMGKVYKAFQPSLERYVAIKTIPPTLAVDKNLLDRFYTEARSLARLNHPNIISVFDIFEQDNVHYIAMEYVEGDSLGEMIIQKGPFSESLAVFIIKSIADALSTTHGLNIIHRDIKPDNIMISTDNRVKLMDFGLARNTTTIGMTATGSIMGTPEYMSPEQCEGVGIDGRSDLYALGITVFETLCGMTPFMGKSVGEIIKIKTTGMSPKIEKFRKDLSKDLGYIVNKLIEHDITYRYQNAHELIHDLDKSKFDMKSHPDKVTILSDSQVLSSPTPTMTALRRTFTRDIRYWGKKEVVWFLILATVFLSFATWGTVKFKERVDYRRFFRIFFPITEQDKQRINDRLENAQTYFQNKEFDPALSVIEKVFDIDVSHAAAEELRVKIISYQDEASKHFEQARQYQILKKWEAVIDEVNKSLEIDPYQFSGEIEPLLVTAYNNLGFLAYDKEEDYQKAIDYYHLALNLDKKNSVIMRNLCDVYFKTGDFEQCVEYGERALKINPNPSDPDLFRFPIYINLGGALLSLGKHREALDMYLEGSKVVTKPNLKEAFYGYIDSANIYIEEAKEATGME